MTHPVHSIQIHAQVTIIGERSPILGAPVREKELPQLCVEVPKRQLPMTERQFMESVQLIGRKLLEQARAAGMVRA